MTDLPKDKQGNIMMEDIHIFGELDLNVSQLKQILDDDIFHIAECCGYFIEQKRQQTLVFGSDNELATIQYNDDNYVQTIHLKQFDDEQNIIMQNTLIYKRN